MLARHCVLELQVNETHFLFYGYTQNVYLWIANFKMSRLYQESPELEAMISCERFYFQALQYNNVIRLIVYGQKDKSRPSAIKEHIGQSSKGRENQLHC